MARHKMQLNKAKLFSKKYGMMKKAIVHYWSAILYQVVHIKFEFTCNIWVFQYWTMLFMVENLLETGLSNKLKSNQV